MPERKFGQNYLCMSMSGAELDKLAEGLLIIGSTVYQNTFTDQKLKKLSSYSKGQAASDSDPGFLNLPFKVSG